MRMNRGLPQVVCCTLVCLFFVLIMTDTDALVCRCWRGNGTARPRAQALKMEAQGFGRPSSASEKKSKASRSSEARGFGGSRASGNGGGGSGGGESKKLSGVAKTARGVVGTKGTSTSATVQKEVMRQTEASIRRSMDDLKSTRPFVWEALELKQRLGVWQAQTANLNVLQLSDLPPRQVQEMRFVDEQLRKLQEEHGISDRLLHNIAQEATWDASARVKDERQANVQLPPSAVQHMQAVVERSGVGADSRVLDAGAGTGILLRFLQGAGVKQERYVGVDLSSVMVEVARARYPQATFLQADFLDYCEEHPSSSAPEGFSHVFFNCCLHNFLEPGEALSGAALLLKKGGRIVISHPKGAANVDMQRRSNPILVPNRLPTAADLEQACRAIPSLKAADIQLVGEDRRLRAGYLQVLQKP